MKFVDDVILSHTLEGNGRGGGFTTRQPWCVFQGVQPLDNFVPVKILEAESVVWRRKIKGIFKNFCRRWCNWAWYDGGWDQVTSQVAIILDDWERRCSRGRAVLDEHGLNIIECCQRGSPSQWGILQMTVGGGVHFKNECREEDIHTQAIHSNKTTSALLLMGPKAVERVAEVRDMEAVPHEDLLTIERNNCRAVTQDGSKGVVPHTHLSSLHWRISNEGTSVGEHMICGP
jgi:hypothetical protein